MGCRGSLKCVCGHPCRRPGAYEVTFCRCCEKLLTARERQTLRFHGDWRYRPWGRALGMRLRTLGAWLSYVRELGCVIVSLTGDPAAQFADLRRASGNR